jgi:LysR family cyn operon transcriptional activator
MRSGDKLRISKGVPKEELDMELRHLRYFIALAEHLNFTRASEQVHVTQSTLSHQIKQFEIELGCRLFDRIGKRVVMTEAGEQILPKFKRALQDIDDSVRGIHGGSQQLSGILRVGVTHTFNISVIPGCVATFHQQHKSVRVSIKERSADMIAKGIEDGEFDLGFTYRPRSDNGLVFEPLCHDEMALVVPPQHRFATRKRIRMSELHQQELILYTKSANTQDFLDEWFKSVGTEPIVVLEVNACAPMPGFIRSLGIPGIMSRLGTVALEDLKVVPIESPTPLRTTGILWSKAEDPIAAAKSFAAVVRHAIINAGSDRPNGAATKRKRASVAKSPLQSPPRLVHLPRETGDGRPVGSSDRVHCAGFRF